MKIVWSLFVFTFVFVGNGWCNTTSCPFNERCLCKKEYSYLEFSDINCKRVPLSQLPTFPDLLIHKLKITESGLQEIGDGAFGNLTTRSLILDNNDLYFLSNKSLIMMNRTLEELSLNNNKLDEIPLNAVFPLESLRTLKLDGNLISSIAVDWSNLKNTLVELCLSNNDLDAIPLTPETSLANLKHLNTVHLSGNLLLSLEANSLPYSLKSLTVSDNYIKDFPYELLNNLQDLTSLNLSDNIIEVIPTQKNDGKIHLNELDLSKNVLGSVKKSFGKSVKISKYNLSKNKIRSIEKEAFSGFDCKEIDLSYNKLSKLDDSPFSGVDSTLENLDLSHNKFDKVPDGIKDLKRLKSFNLAHNNLYKVKNSLHYFKELEKLSLSGNLLGVFPFEALGSLNSLTSLDLSYNKLADIRKSDFKTWGQNLKKLYLQSNSLFYLDNSTFTYTPKLTELSLSYNTIGDIFLGAFKNLDQIQRFDISFSLKGYGFPTPLLSMKSLQYLALDNNNINAIPSDLTKLDSIRTLILDFNRIKEIETNSFDSKAHKYLQDLRLSFNYINKINSNTFSDLNGLQFISLHNNKIIKIDEYAFINLPQNLSIYLSNNKLEDIVKNAFSTLPKLKVLDLHGNNIQTFDYNVFHMVTTENEPMTLNLSRNRIENLKVPDFQRAPVYIGVLDLEHNKLSNIEKIVEIQSSLKSLNLGYNEISAIKTTDFYSMVALEDLNLIHNKIVSIEDNSFVSLKKLQFFNISHNHIEELAGGLFKNLINLRILDLSFNNIRTISNSAFDNTKIERLYLSNNKISSITAHAFINIGKMLRTLDLSHNQILVFGQDLFQDAPKLQNLHLCHNNMSVDSLAAFQNSASLFKLDLCGNYFASIPHNTFTNSTRLRELNLAATGLQSFPNLTLPNLLHLTLSENKIKNLSEAVFSGLPKLKALNLSRNEISVLNGINWIQIPSLRDLDLSHNPIKVLDKPCFFGLYNLKKLNIQNLDSINQLDSGIFMDLNELVSLKVDFQRRLDLNLNKTLSHLKYLKELSLHVKDSRLSNELPQELPKKLQKLEITGKDFRNLDIDDLKGLKSFIDFKLSITNTDLSSFPKHFFSNFKNKKFIIDLTNNQLQRIGPEILYNTLGDIRRYGTKGFKGGIDLRGNPLACGCEVKWLADWLRRYIVESLDVNNQSIEARLRIIEGMNQLTCFDKKTNQNFPILTYDLSSDELLCGIVLNVPKVKDTKGAAGRAGSMGIMMVLVLGFVSQII